MARTIKKSPLEVDDFFILELNYDKNEYEIYGSNTNITKKIKDIRLGTKDLMISSMHNHLRRK